MAINIFLTGPSIEAQDPIDLLRPPTAVCPEVESERDSLAAQLVAAMGVIDELSGAVEERNELESKYNSLVDELDDVKSALSDAQIQVVNYLNDLTECNERFAAQGLAFAKYKSQCHCKL